MAPSFIRKSNSLSSFSLSSTSSIDTTINIPTTLYNDPPKKKSKGTFHKILKIFNYTLFIIFLLAITFILWKFISKNNDKNKLNEYIEKYSKRLNINGNKMSYDIVGESHNITIVILPGFGSISPIIEFKSLNDALCDKYKIVTLEPFGYGFSDKVDTERTLENVVSELHECTKNLGIENYYLMGHSTGGLYSLEWANEYPNEVLGFIGLDNDVPGQENIPGFSEMIDDSSNGDELDSFKNFAFYRLRSSFNDKSKVDVNFNYANGEIEEIEKLLASNNGYNDVIMNEKLHIVEHLSKLKGKTFPEKVPSIHFLANDNDNQPLWEKLHRDVIGNNTNSEVITLNGSHYIYIDQKDAVVKKIKEWVN